MKKIAVVIIAVIVVLALGGAVAWLFASGKLVWADTATKPATAKVVCGADIVKKYNDAATYIERQGAKEPSLDEDGIKSVKAEIKQQANYANDPTCETILYLIAIHDGNYEEAKTAYEAVKEMHDHNIFPDNNINNNAPLSMYEADVYALSPEGKAQKGIGG